MPKIMISQTKKTSLKLLNIFLFSITLFLVLIIAIYQLFVDKNYRPIGIKNFFNLKTVSQIFSFKNSYIESKCFTDLQNIIFKENNLIKLNNLSTDQDRKIYDLGNEKLISKIFYNSEQEDLVFLTNYNNSFWLIFYNLQTGNLDKIMLNEGIKTANIINLDSKSNIYLYYKKKDKNSWTVSKVNKQEQNSIIEDIIYPGVRLTASLEKIENLIIYPFCSQVCEFKLYSLNDGQISSLKITSLDSSADVFPVNLLYYDEKESKIIYTLPDKDIAYITGLDGYLWHHIYLTLSGENKININGLVKDYENKKKLLATSDYKKQAYIYDINYIGLKTLELKDNFKVVDDQINLYPGCLVLQKNNQEEYWLRDFVVNKDKLILKDKQFLSIF